MHTDEPWVNVGHTVGKAWNDTSIQGIGQTHLEGLTTGLKSPSGLVPRFALVHEGCEKGFITGAELTFVRKKNIADAHQEMDADKYEQWFIKQLLPNLPQNSIIVLDNVSYYTRKVEKIPTTTGRKEQIVEWLNEKQIPIEGGMLKRDLLVCVSQLEPHYDKIEDHGKTAGKVCQGNLSNRKAITSQPACLPSR